MSSKYWRKFFEYGVLIKGFNGLWETAGGLLFLLLSKATLNGWFYPLISNELIEDPSDKIINFMAQALQNISSDIKTFVALYVLVHGLLNIFLAVQIYREKSWAYLVIIGVMLVSEPYQIYRISINHSIVLTAITAFDVIFIILAWHEYKRHRTAIISSNTSLPR